VKGLTTKFWEVILGKNCLFQRWQPFWQKSCVEFAYIQLCTKSNCRNYPDMFAK